MTLRAAALFVARRDGFVVLRPNGDRPLPLTAVRTGPRSALPVLVVPGGPGQASVLPFRGFRALGAQHGLDVIMVEHRGVGLSRQDDTGRDLTRDVITVEAAADDLAAVLDAAGVARAVVYGASYGSYLAQVLAVRHRDRVATLVLDSPVLSVRDDLAAVRAFRRRRLWDGAGPLATAVREVAEVVPMAELARVVEVTYEYAGPDALLRLLRARSAGRRLRTWKRIAGLDSESAIPYVFEPDLVAGISYGQLGFGLEADGSPLDPQLTAPTRPFLGEPYDLAAELSSLPVPLIVLSGDQDLRTPRPVAERAATLAPQSILLAVRGMGHSALDSHQEVALHVAASAVHGTTTRLPALAGRLSALPRRGHSAWLGRALVATLSGLRWNDRHES